MKRFELKRLYDEQLSGEKKRIFIGLNNEEFKGLPGVCMSDVMTTEIIPDIQNYTTLKKTLVKLLRDFFSYRAVIKEGNGDFCFLKLVVSSRRPDFDEWYHKAMGLVKESFVLILGKRRFSLKAVSGLVVFRNWFGIFKKYYNVKDALYYTERLLSFYCTYKEIAKLIGSPSVKRIATICDTWVEDSLVIQHCNYIGKVTFTFEHGYYPANPMFASSHAKHFLGYGQFEYEQAEISGFNMKCFIKTGMPKLIGIDIPNELQLKKNKIIGMIFNGDALAYENRNMIQIVGEYARDRDYEIFVKLHPASDPSLYKEEFAKYHVTRLFKNELNAWEFAELVEVAVSSVSTVMIEYAAVMIPIILLRSELKVYEGWDGLKFSDKAGFEFLIEKIEANDESYIDDLDRFRHYYSEIEDVTEKYKRALELD